MMWECIWNGSLNLTLSYRVLEDSSTRVCVLVFCSVGSWEFNVTGYAFFFLSSFIFRVGDIQAASLFYPALPSLSYCPLVLLSPPTKRHTNTDICTMDTQTGAPLSYPACMGPDSCPSLRPNTVISPLFPRTERHITKTTTSTTHTSTPLFPYTYYGVLSLFLLILLLLSPLLHSQHRTPTFSIRTQNTHAVLSFHTPERPDMYPSPDS